MTTSYKDLVTSCAFVTSCNLQTIKQFFENFAFASAMIYKRYADFARSRFKDFASPQSVRKILILDCAAYMYVP